LLRVNGRVNADVPVGGGEGGGVMDHDSSRMISSAIDRLGRSVRSAASSIAWTVFTLAVLMLFLLSNGDAGCDGCGDDGQAMEEE